MFNKRALMMACKEIVDIGQHCPYTKYGECCNNDPSTKCSDDGVAAQCWFDYFQNQSVIRVKEDDTFENYQPFTKGEE